MSTVRSAGLRPVLRAAVAGTLLTLLALLGLLRGLFGLLAGAGAWAFPVAVLPAQPDRPPRLDGLHDRQHDASDDTDSRRPRGTGDHDLPARRGAGHGRGQPAWSRSPGTHHGQRSDRVFRLRIVP